MARSSLIQRAVYDASQQTLAVTFTSGRTYLYLGVPAEVYSEFAAAESRGRYFNWRIRDRYAFRELE
jgi:hypothetical protein